MTDDEREEVFQRFVRMGKHLDEITQMVRTLIVLTLITGVSDDDAAKMVEIMEEVGFKDGDDKKEKH